MGVGFSSSTPDIQTTGGLTASSTSQADAIQEQEISFSQMAMREQLISTLSWSTAVDAGVNLFDVELPYGVLVSNTLRVAFERFVYWFGDCHIRIAIQSNAFQQGQLIASFVPLTGVAEDEETSTLTDRSIRRNVILKAGTTNSKTLIVPFASLYAAYQPTAQVPLGNFALTVMNRLRHGPTVTGTADKVEISIFVSFPNANFRVIQPVNDIIVSPQTTALGLLRSRIKLQGGVASKVTNIHIDKVTGSTVDVKSDKDTMDTKQSGTVGGLDRPNIGLNYFPVRQMKYPDFATGKNLDFCGVLDLDPGNAHMMNPTDIAQTEDENDIKYHLTKWCYVKTKSVSDAMPTGTIIDSDWMTIAPATFAAFDTAVFQPSLMEYVSLPYTLWRGSIKLRFEFIMTKIHVARLSFITHYGGEVTDADLVNSYGQYAQIFDVTGDNNTFEVEIPYRAAYDWLKVPHGSGSIKEYTMGQWSLRVLNPLVVMDSVADRIEYNMYMCAGDDIELKFFGSGTADSESFVSNTVPVPAVMPSIPVPTKSDLRPMRGQESALLDRVLHMAQELKVQSGETELVADVGLDTVAESKVPSIAVVPSDSPMPPCNRDDWRSLRTCFKRSAPVLLGPDLVSKTVLVHELLDDQPIISWYSKMFRVWSGPLKLRVFTGGVQGTVGYVPCDTTADLDLFKLAGKFTDATGFVPIQLTDKVVSYMDVQVPFVTNKKFVLTTRGFPKTYSDEFYSNGKVFVELAIDPVPSADRGLYLAGGDTFRMAMLISVPKIRITRNFFAHGGANVVPLPASILFMIQASAAPNSVTQEDINSGIIASQTGISITLSTNNWTREQWNRMYGANTLDPYQFPDPSLATETRNTFFPLGSLFVPTRVSITQGILGVANSFGFTNVIKNGNVNTLRQLNGANVYTADNWEIDYISNSDQPAKYAQILGLEFATGQIMVPQNSTGTGAVHVNQTQTSDGIDVYMWDKKSNLAFNTAT